MMPSSTTTGSNRGHFQHLGALYETALSKHLVVFISGNLLYTFSVKYNHLFTLEIRTLRPNLLHNLAKISQQIRNQSKEAGEMAP